MLLLKYLSCVVRFTYCRPNLTWYPCKKASFVSTCYPALNSPKMQNTQQQPHHPRNRHWNTHLRPLQIIHHTPRQTPHHSDTFTHRHENRLHIIRKIRRPREIESYISEQLFVVLEGFREAELRYRNTKGRRPGCVQVREERWDPVGGFVLCSQNRALAATVYEGRMRDGNGVITCKCISVWREQEI
jgi:hypothetical protein